MSAWNDAQPGVVLPMDPAGPTRPGLDTGAAGRREFQVRQYGNKKGTEKMVARIKPYVQDEDDPRIYDWMRVIGIAISSARPYDQLDIKLQRQSM